MNETVQVALIIGFTGLVGPLFLSLLNARDRRNTRREDYKRQDEVAERLLKNTAKSEAKLDIIHALVDGALTAALHSELAETVRNLKLQHEVMKLKESLGETVRADDYDQLTVTQTKIDELWIQISDRETQEAKDKRKQLNGAGRG